MPVSSARGRGRPNQRPRARFSSLACLLERGHTQSLLHGLWLLCAVILYLTVPDRVSRNAYNIYSLAL